MPEHFMVKLPSDGVNYVKHFLICKKCNAKLAEGSTKVVKCTECGLSQLKASCKTKIIASIMSLNDKNESLNLTLFNEVIEKLYIVYQGQNPGSVKEFKQLTEDEIIEMLLTVEVCVLFNEKNNVIKVLDY